MRHKRCLDNPTAHNYQVWQMRKDLPEFLSTDLKVIADEPTTVIPSPIAPKSTLPPGTVGLQAPTDPKKPNKPATPGSAPQIQNPTKDQKSDKK